MIRATDSLAQVIDALTADKQPKTGKHYRGGLVRFERYLERQATHGDVTAANIEACCEWLKSCGYKSGTLRATRQVLGKLLEYINAGPVESPPPVAAAAPPPAVPPFVPSAPPAFDADPQSVTIGQLVSAWRQYAETFVRKEELANMNCALRPLEVFHRDDLVCQFGPRKLRAVLMRMIEGYTVGQKLYPGISRTGINARLNRIRRVFRWGVAEELVGPLVLQALLAIEPLRYGRTQAAELEPVGPVDDAIVEATLLQLPPVVADMVRFQRLTSARPGEVCAITPAAIDRTGEVWAYRPSHHKTRHKGKIRVVYIGPQAQQILKPYIDTLPAPDWHCFNPQQAADWRLAKLVPGRLPSLSVDRRYKPKSYSRAVRRACERHGIEPWHPNQLRHAAATAVRKQFGLEAAQVILGHSRADVTQVYAEKNDAHGIEVMRKIG